MMSKKEISPTLVYSLFALVILSMAATVYVKVSDERKITALQQETTEMKQQAESQINALNTLLQNSQEENNKKLRQLTSTVQQTRAESEAKLSELEENVKGISIEAGDFSAIVEEALKGVVSVITDIGQGSGAVITRDGYVVTNYHVIEGAQQLAVLAYNKKLYHALVIGKEKVNDIAVLKIDSNDTFEKLMFTNSDNVKIGEKVAALGNPAGLGFTVTQGIISQKDRVISGSIGLLQTDVAINPGNSGGPLINPSGKIIGIRS